jgi:CRP/FNR family transcriptional regulator, cyclic AMP receptor protein
VNRRETPNEPDPSDWLAKIPASFRKDLLAHCKNRRMTTGQTVFRSGDTPDGLYGVISGGFALEMSPHERGPNFTHIFRPGSWFGEAELVDDRPRIVTIAATRPSECLFISKRDFMAIAQCEPDAWRWLGVLATEHLQLALGAIDDLTIRRPGPRIAAILLRLGGVRLSDLAHDPAPQIDLTQQDLSHVANISRATVAEHLGQFEKAGFIECSYGRMTIRDPAALRAHLAVLESAPGE